MRKIVAVIGATLLMAGCQGGPGIVGFFGGGDDYFPLSEGARWDYDLFVDGTKAGTASAVASLVTTKDNATTADVRMTLSVKGADGKVTDQISTSKYKKLADEVQYTDSKGVVTTELKLPLKTGMSFVTNGATVEVKAQEDISTAAGGYRGAWKLVGDNSGNITTSYYANNVGLVKSTLKASGSVEMTLELTSFKK